MATPSWLLAAQDVQLAIVVADSVALRLKPVLSAPVARFGHATLQLQVLSATPDTAWLKVKTGESKGYQLRHADEYWVRRQDVVIPTPTRASIDFDVSVHEVPAGHFGRRISADEFLEARGAIRDSFYVSTRYTNPSDPSCSSPFGACAMIYRPGHYLLDLREEPAWLAPLLDELYADATVRVRYEVTASVPIRRVHERLIAARVLMADAGCYAEHYQGTDVATLRDIERRVDSRRASSEAEVGPEVLFAAAAGAPPQYVNLLWVLEPTYEDGTTELIVRRLMIWWAMCL
jgi:hypothetical protein